MIRFDGMRFTRSSKVVRLPMDMFLGEAKNFVMFGRVIGSEQTLPKGFVKTNYTDEYGEVVYAKPVECVYHSLTNMMLGKDGYWYLAKNGFYYIYKHKKP